MPAILLPILAIDHWCNNTLQCDSFTKMSLCVKILFLFYASLKLFYTLNLNSLPFRNNPNLLFKGSVNLCYCLRDTCPKSSSEAPNSTHSLQGDYLHPPVNALQSYLQLISTVHMPASELVCVYVCVLVVLQCSRMDSEWVCVCVHLLVWTEVVFDPAHPIHYLSCSQLALPAHCGTWTTKLFTPELNEHMKSWTGLDYLPPGSALLFKWHHYTAVRPWNCLAAQHKFQRNWTSSMAALKGVWNKWK